MRALIFFFLILFLGCNDEEPVIDWCSELVEIKVDPLETTFLPYDEYVHTSLQLSNSLDTLLLLINHFAELQFFRVQKSSTETVQLPCENFRVERYEWEKKTNLALLTIIGENAVEDAIAIKELPIIDEENPPSGQIGFFLEFYIMDIYSGRIKDDPFMRISTISYQEEKANALELNVLNESSIILCGNIYENVFVNTQGLPGFVKKMYYTFDEGIIAIMDEESNIWCLK